MTNKNLLVIVVTAMKKTFIIVIVVILVLVGGLVLYANHQMQQVKMQKEQQAMQQQQAMELKHQQDMHNAILTQTAVKAKQTVIQLAEENNSGESGTATFDDVNGKVKVTLDLAGFPANPQPAHIHVGKCPGVGKVVYPLTNVVNGKSETTLNVSMDDLKNQLPLALNVHKSAAAINVYTACGELQFAGVSPAAGSGTPVTSPTTAISPTNAPTSSSGY